MAISSFYIDILSKTDLSGELQLAYNEDAVKIFIRNVLETNRGEKKFDPNFGSNLRKYLFEPVDIGTAFDILSEVEDGILSNDEEGRIRNLNVKVTPDVDNNAFIVDITYKTNVSPEQQKLQVVLQKIR